MPRVKSYPQKRKGDLVPGGRVQKKIQCRDHRNLAPVDILSVKAVSTTRLKKHKMCHENAKHFLESFHSYIRVHRSMESKFQIGQILMNVTDDISSNFMEQIYGVYVGDDDISILCLVQNASDDGVEERYFIASSSVPLEILCSFATKYFVIAYAASPSPGTFYFDVLLSEANFPEIRYPSQDCKVCIRSAVKKVIEFFYEPDVAEDSPPAVVQKQQYLSQFFGNIVHEKGFDVDVQHPNLIPHLRPYQKEAVKWMLSREQKQGIPVPETPNIHPLFEELTTVDEMKLYYNKVAGYFSLEPQYAVPPCKGGILADEMGLGKTVEVLACILNNPKQDVRMELAAKRVKHQEHPSSKRDIVPESSAAAFSCCCGESGYDESDLDLVKCQMCGILQHAKCFNYSPSSSDYVYYCPHCWVQDSMELVQSGATLIVSPHRICYQWEDEIRKHVQDRSLKILSYKGLAHHNFIQPTVLAEYDIVLTTYEVLKKELNYVDLPYSSRSRALRRPQKFYCPPSPLPAVLWWRLCLDEAQMAEHATSRTAKMALELNSVHRWCVTGTPLQRNVDDLYGLFMFLGYDPYYIRTWWREALYLPFCHGDPKPLTEALQPVLWRTMKKNVLDQINIPQQDIVIHWTKFSPVEEYFYTEQYRNCSVNLHNHISSSNLDVQLKSLDKDFLSKVFIPVRELRQACCHPQVVRGHFVSVQKTFLTMDEVLETLIKKAQYKAEDAHRQLVAALNGLAGINIVSKNLDEAITYYKKALSSSHVHSSKLRTDNLQLYHAFFNMADILTRKNLRFLHVANKEVVTENSENLQEILDTGSREKQNKEEQHPALTEPLSLQKIVNEAERIKRLYLEKTMEAIECAKQNFLLVSEEVKKLNTAIGSTQPWWIVICDYAVKAIKDAAFVEKLRNDLLAAVTPGRLSVGHKFHDIRGLCFILYNLLIELNKYHDLLKKSVKSLPDVPSECDVILAAACHLRPAIKQNNRITLCRYCKVQEKFDMYENKLFHGIGRTGLTMEPLKLSNSCQHCSSEDESPCSTVLLYNPAGAQGTWADSELERIFKALLVFGRSNQVSAEVIESANTSLQWMAALKKEFRALRNLWIKLTDHVSAVDELNMASQRFRLEHPHDIHEDPPVSYILTENQVEPMKQKLLSDEAISRVRLQDGLFKLLYLQNLREVENEKNAKENASSKICPVCHQQLKAMWTVLPCGHCLCSECVHHLIKEYPLLNRPAFFRCPVCREETCNKEVFYIGNEVENPLEKEFPVQGSFSTKVSAVVRCLLQIHKTDPSAKSLVFSEWLDLLNIIASALQRNEIPFVSLRTKKTFQSDLLKFKLDSSINTALLPIHSCASGLNIIEATHVLLVEPLLHPSWELQAIGRVHRIGQTKKTTVHRFIMKDSIEEKIYHLLPTDCQSEDEVKFKESCLTLKDLQELF